MKITPHYAAPEVEMVELVVELGFAGSVTGDGNEGGDGGSQDY